MKKLDAEIENDLEEIDVVKKVDRFFKEAKDYRSNFESEWEEQQEFYNGQQWPLDSQDRPFINKCFEVVQTEEPLLTDSKPATDVIPFDMDDDEQQEKAKMLNAAKDAVYTSQCLQQKDAMSINKALQSGTAFQYVDWNPDLYNGEGDVTVKNIPWEQIFADPAATEIDEARYFGAKFPVDIEELKRRYPGKAEEIEEITPDFDTKAPTHIDEDQNLRQYTGRMGISDRYKSDSITVLDVMFFKDYTMVDISEEETQSEIAKESLELQQGINPDISKEDDHVKHLDGHREQKYFIAAAALQVPAEQVTEKDIEALEEDEKIGLILKIIDDHIDMHESIYAASPLDSGKRPKYKNFMRLVTKTGSKILYDGPAPVDDGLYPFAIFYAHKDEDSFFGTGILKNVIPLNKAINEKYYAEYVGLQRNSNSGWIVDENSNVDENTLTNDPGLVVVKRAGSEVSRIPPGEVSPQLAQSMGNDNAFVKEITGLGSAIQGTAPSDDPSGEAIKRMMMQQLGRVRSKSRWLEEYSIPRRDRLIISRIIKYYSTERKLRIYDDSGKIRYIDYRPEMIKGFDYDLVISPGTSGSYDKQTIYVMAQQMLGLGIIDAKTFIEMTNPPYRGRILERIASRDQDKTMMQNLMQENLQLKAQFAPQALTPEEIKLLQNSGSTTEQNNGVAQATNQGM